ncbi:MAG: U32 family peptidase [Eubacteriales bacterium]|nr:U32 family peptidase [Eubacteriales bacterium]
MNNRKRPELLSPAGNFEKLKTAILYGADAVYLSLKRFGMRCAADNFSEEELALAVEYAHSRGVRVYLTLNTMPRENEYPELRTTLEKIKDFGIDAFIIADIGVLNTVKEIIPDAEIHISTQANAVSSADCRAWYGLGAKRVVLARELTLDEIKEIRRNIPDELELEAFIHGSMCISYSGRCLLSGFFTGRDANRGACTQPCRWNYKIRGVDESLKLNGEAEFDGGRRISEYEITEQKRPDVNIPITEINGETFIMSSRDTRTVEYIPLLVDAGIDSFKIEGRMKSAYYVACTTNVYRMALDACLCGNTEVNPLWLRELDSVSHREYGSGYYFSDSNKNANTCKSTGYAKEKAYLATVLEYNNETALALCRQKNKFSVGDTVELLSPGRLGMKFTVKSLLDTSGKKIDAVPHPQMDFYMEMPFSVNTGDIIRSSDMEE